MNQRTTATTQASQPGSRPRDVVRGRVRLGIWQAHLLWPHPAQCLSPRHNGCSDCCMGSPTTGPRRFGRRLRVPGRAVADRQTTTRLVRTKQIDRTVGHAADRKSRPSSNMGRSPRESCWIMGRGAGPCKGPNPPVPQASIRRREASLSSCSVWTAGVLATVIRGS
jgi:hypothetical protein